MNWLRDKNSRDGIIGTIFFHIVVIFILFLLSLKPPFPPPPQLGVEVNLGDGDQGMGDIQPETPNQTSASKPKTSENIDNVATQSTEQSIKMNKNNKKKIATPITEPVKQKIDDRFIFNKSNGKNNGGNEGNTGKPGDQGNKNGDPNAKNYIGDGGNGVSFNLSGRNKRKLPLPPKGFTEEGRVVVKVWVNRDGMVTNATISIMGTTTTSSSLRKRAIDAAMKSEFDSKPDAPEVQTGTITYVFILSN
ncbi:MAG: hypothetical protein AUJ98_11035 [Bacteroidetes bacterium CG2_30_33_31]|nr:MAG: hypothetical protein AUJ98_11035 [Bacteroidetes bacterium CG2_30_33_31]